MLKVMAQREEKREARAAEEIESSDCEEEDWLG